MSGETTLNSPGKAFSMLASLLLHQFKNRQEFW